MAASLSMAAPLRGGDPLSAVFMALADPTRRAMLKSLALGERTLTELAAPLSISLPAVTKHLRILERAGLISRSRQAQRKPCSLEVQPLNDAAQWIAQYRAEWEARMDRLDAFVLTLQKQEDARRHRSPKPSHTPRKKKEK